MAQTESSTENKLHWNWEMCLEEKRLKTFNNWQIGDDDWDCTPEKLAAAGFCHCPTAEAPDAVKCFMCLKELDGWEPKDDPWEEHRSHSPKCPFLKLKEPVEELTVQELISLEVLRLKIFFEKKSDMKLEEFTDHTKAVQEEMSNLI